MNKKPLIFGDPESIERRDIAIRDNIVKHLMETIKCPFCGAKPTDCYDADIENDCFGFNFECKKDCLNSVESAEHNCWGSENDRTACNSKGVFYK
jgi:hypothetical protein